jgi:hypothetical protein
MLPLAASAVPQPTLQASGLEMKCDEEGRKEGRKEEWKGGRAGCQAGRKKEKLDV